MASKLREDNQTLADIRPSRIYYNSYQLSAVPYGIFPDQDISLVEKVKDREQQVFFAPEQQKEFQSGQQEIVDGDEFFEKNFKQESFQIGLTILYAATLNEDNPCYDYDKIAFLPQEVGNLLGQFRDNYYQSERKERLLMYTLEVLLLDPNPKTRKLPSEIYSILKGFEKNIKFMSGSDEFKQKLEEQFNQNFTSYKAYVNRA
ncbi:hypothetical protein PPERSA_07689 [Pseudocohnilembus persalinus]|uniref:Protein kinase-like domain n=1 Tax=Pseudocohnilembus persalinus TaxID=266149 RepID=A0A0V0QIS5_PSEPJ|nr:hypothetical protein PPERSA_07689 [Pseudocohnilembus persalinus]|eukprot:KRX02044.1 hypothetical protein PPERSA_07689 [Pseudocohnilembus persalinus]